MSEAAYSLSKEVRHRCESCEQRKARFCYRGVVKSDRDHSLCFECFRAERERRRARLLAEIPPPATVRLLEPRRTLTTRDIAHRRRMLQHLHSARG